MQGSATEAGSAQPDRVVIMSVRATSAAAGTTALAGAAMSVLDRDGGVAVSGTTDDSGQFAVIDLPPGSYTLAVSARGHLPAAVPLTVDRHGEGLRGVTLAAVASIAGRVVGGRRQRPVAEAVISVRDAAGYLVTSALTGEDGGYAIDGIPHGDYVVTVTGFPPRTGWLGVQPGDRIRHDVALCHEDPD